MHDLVRRRHILTRRGGCVPFDVWSDALIPYTQYDGATFDFLFFPTAAPLRKDLRFMKLAARVGLVDYWTKSGHWPDFCNEPGLPYNCQDEAVRLGKS